MSFQQAYQLNVSDLDCQGTHITLTKCQRTLECGVFCLAGMIVSMLSYQTDQPLQQSYILLLSILVTVGLAFKYLTTIHTESVLMVSSIGLTIKQESLLSSSTKYFDVQQIKDVVIVEAVSLHSVIFQIVLVPKVVTEKDKRKIYPLFKAFHPCLDDLKTVYRHVQDKLIIPYQQTLQT